ncbi:MAG: NAD(P)/FAD-dependent oxidoreductase [Actinomycetota bacterium]|nr:NAD(P)/FAD-dependent oxidoreductase [Actinomycetota bacterium]
MTAGERRPPVRILVLGGGYIGLYSALKLQRRLKRGDALVTLVAPETFMTYQPLLPEAASGNIEPRHVVVPLRKTLRRTRLVTGSVSAVDSERKTATIVPLEGAPYEEPYDVLIVGIGSIARALPVPGLAEHAIGFKSVAEAIYLRNQVIARMDAAESTADPEVRQRALTFVFVGGGYAGIEVLAELEDLARDASRSYRTVSRGDMRWVLVEAAPSILPEIGPRLAKRALDRLRERDIEVHLSTRLESAEGGVMALSNGDSFPAETLVWTTGVRPHPVVSEMGFEVDEKGRLMVDEYLRVVGAENAWAGGDCAAVPDLTTGGIAPLTAQHALRQARTIGDNVVASLRGGEPRPFQYRNRGSLVSLGRYKGVARVMGLQLSGWPAWFLHRTYHVAMIPTFNRKVRVLVDWTVALFFKRDIIQLGSLTNPREPLRQSVSSLVEGRE